MTYKTQQQVRKEQLDNLKSFIYNQVSSIQGVELKENTNSWIDNYTLEYRGHSFYFDTSCYDRWDVKQLIIKTDITNVPYVKNREDKTYFMRYLKNKDELTFNVGSYKESLDKLVTMKEELIQLKLEKDKSEKQRNNITLELKESLNAELCKVFDENIARRFMQYVEFNTNSKEMPYRLLGKDFNLSCIVNLARVWEEGL